MEQPVERVLRAINTQPCLVVVGRGDEAALAGRYHSFFVTTRLGLIQSAITVSGSPLRSLGQSDNENGAGFLAH